ncbi:MAG: OmpA family protein [Bacteroidales bacterium]|nr:OmpA family protein [Bacteroidales bacterium]
MKKLLPILLTLFFTGALFGQTPQADPYQEQYVSFYKVYSQNPDDVANLISMAEFFSDPVNPQFNLPLAYSYIKRAEEVYTQAVQDKKRYREVQKLIRAGVSITTLRQSKRDIEAQAVMYVRNHLGQMRSFEVAAYMEAFSENKELTRQLRSKMQSDAFALVKEENTINGYYTFSQQYPHTPQADSAETFLSKLAPRYFSSFTTEEPIDSVAALYPNSKALQSAAMRQKSRIAYSAARRANSVEAYSSYLERFPRGDDYMEALSLLEELRNSELSTLTTPEELASYVESHADDPMADSALALLRSMVVDQHSQEAAQVYLKRFPLDPEYTNIYSKYYNWYAEEGNRQPIEAFAMEHPDFPFSHTVKSDLERAERIDRYDFRKPFVESYFDSMTTVIRLLTGRKVAFVALQRTLQQLIARKDWAAAQHRLQKFELSFEDFNHAEYVELSALLTGHGGPVASPYYNNGDSISNVVVSPLGKIYFLTHKAGRQALCCAERATGKKVGWKAPVRVTVKGVNADITPYNFYDEGQRVLLGIHGDIWTAQVVSDTLWVAEGPLMAPVNTPYIEKDAFMLEDGSGLLLASDRPGGHNVQKSGSYYHGDNQLATDLYYIPCNGGRWGEAVNLGYGVNSSYCEHSPLLSRNMRTLYFITDARGLGYGDIYCATRSDINDWTHWSTPVNMGRNVNGSFDETTLSFGANERQIVFTTLSPQGERSAAYYFATRHDTNSAYRTVQVDFEPVIEVLRNVRLAEVSTQTTSHHCTDRQIDTLQTYRLYKGEEYAVLVEADWYYVPTLFVGKEVREGQSPLAKYEMRGYTWDELKSMDEPIALPLVRFFEGTARLLPLGEVELRMLGHYMQQRTRSQIEVAVHVEGSDDRACYDLSIERAQAVRSFLVAYGVDASRVRISAYGNVAYKKDEKKNEVEISFF